MTPLGTAHNVTVKTQVPPLPPGIQAILLLQKCLSVDTYVPPSTQNASTLLPRGE